jgi:hypothetical protein
MLTIGLSGLATFGVAAASVAVGSRVLFTVTLLAGALAVSLLLSWRTLTLGVIALVLVEALPRRYLVNEVTIFFVKDVALAVAYVKYIRHRIATGAPVVPRTWSSAALVVFAAILLVQAFNPLLPTVAVGLIGLHGWVWTLPLVFLVGAAFSSAHEAVRAVRRFGLASLPLAVLAVVQIYVPAANATYYADIHGKASYHVGDTIIDDRSVGTFASTGAYADYLVFVTIATLGLIVAARTRRDRAVVALFFTGLVLALGGAGTRAVTITAAVSILVLLALRPRLDRRNGFAVAVTACFFLAVATAHPLLSAAMSQPILPGLTRAGTSGLSPSSIGFRVQEHVVEPAETVATAPTQRGGAQAPSRATVVFGRGLGLGTPGRQHLEPLLSTAERDRVSALAGPEAGWMSVLWELGYTGVLLLAALFTVLIAVAGRTFRAARSFETQALAATGMFALASTAILMVFAIKLGAINYSVFFWASVGLIFAATGFAKSEQAWRP